VARKVENLEMSIPSVLDEITKVEKMAERAADKMKFSEEEKDSLAIAVTEAVNNAILHGNKQDKNKKVHIKFEFENTRLVVSIKDEGKGFNPDKISEIMIFAIVADINFKQIVSPYFMLSLSTCSR